MHGAVEQRARQHRLPSATLLHTFPVPEIRQVSRKRIGKRERVCVGGGDLASVTKKGRGDRERTLFLVGVLLVFCF